MVNLGRPSSSGNRDSARAAAVEWLRRFGPLVAAALLALVCGALFFGLRPGYALFASVVLIVLAALLAARPPEERPEGRDGAGRAAWPDAAMKATVEAFPKPAFLLDDSGTVGYANTLAARLFPATRPGDAFALTFRRPEFSDALEIAASGETSSVAFRGETSTSYEVAISPLRAPDGGVEFLLVTFDDVSDRMAVARMRADFVANASHELRTPLASLTGFIETLLGPARKDPEATEKFLRVMLEQAQRMRRLIDDLLSLSRVEMRAHSRPTTRVDLVPVVRQVVDAMQPLAASHSVTLSVDPLPASAEIVGDRDELIQLVQNLAENAIRYGASGERVEIGLAAQPAEGLAAIRVRDHGPGIAAEHIPRLTERFYRVDVGASREMKGTGLGLAIVKHILTRHRGRLEVESRPGEGACFVAVLPLAGESQPVQNIDAYQ